MAANSIIVTRDFRERIEVTEPTSEDLFDDRLGIYSRDNTYTMESYRAYLKWANLVAQSLPSLDVRAKTEGADYMLSLGFVPLVMAPYFWGDKAHAMILPHVPKELPYYPRPVIPFARRMRRWDFPDIWVSKLDVARLCGKKPELIRTEEALQVCGL